jgi:hypothetical protein
MNKKIIATVISVVILASIAPVFAQGVDTHAYVPSGGAGAKPIVKAKWETPDEDPSKPWTQITPPLTYLGTKPIYYWMIVTDTDGWDNIDSALC